MDKLESTKRIIVQYLGACGEQELSDIVTEVKIQAYLSQLPKALHQLQLDHTIEQIEGSYGLIYENGMIPESTKSLYY